MALSSQLDAAEDRGLQVASEDADLVLCRGWRLGVDGKSCAVLIVRPARDQPHSAGLDRLAHEYALRDELDGAWATRPLELHQDGRRTMLVLEDPGGDPLDQLLGEPMEMGRFLRLAIGIAAALGQVHHRGLVHKDIKPAHILVDRATEEVRLTGFGIASRLPRERQAPEPPEFIAGTLAYMAPEQTGRMNRSVDTRTDLYSLGVTLYQMLTGTLPFTASEAMEWVHCHVARRPVPPAERVQTVPPPLSAIVLKLLAKTAEERYQTAAGLERDLRRCLAQWESRGHIEDFPVGEQDRPDRLLLPEKLYGREREIGVLLAAFDRVVQGGPPELVLVSGYSGIGKSSVAGELHKVLVPPRGLFASGKFDQYKRDIPYATLAQALQGLIRPLLGKSDAELAPWREALAEALGPNGGLMVPLIPELEALLGRQPPVPELPPQDAQQRFRMVFRRLLGVFARPEHPLALFLDDLQWLDAATLDLLEYLATEPELRHLLLVGAYRDNEVTPAHPLVRRLETIRAAGGRVQEIGLAPLGLADVGRLIADALQCPPGRAEPLALLVHEKTGGNPFFTIQFLTALAEEGLLAVDPDREGWAWDLERIEAKGYTDNVVDLMVGKLGRLQVAAQQALQTLACLGNSAAIGTLAMVQGTTEDICDTSLWEAVRAGLVLRQEETCRFLHDRVQEAAYTLIPEDERAAEHLRIGRLRAAGTPPEAIEEHVFEIVGQLNRGAALVTAPEERELVAELNLLAAKRAMTATAYVSALEYLAVGATVLGDDAWDRRHELIFELELNRAECEFLTGALADAENRLAVLSRRAVGLIELAAVTCIQEDLYTTLTRADRGIEVALDYLRRVGVDWSAQPADEDVQREYERIRRQLDQRAIESLAALPPMTDPVWRATMDVLTAAVAPAWFTNQNLYGLVIGRLANISLEHGNSDASCYAYALLASLLGPLFGNYEAALRFGELAVGMVEKHGMGRFKARVYMLVGHHVVPWTRPIRTGRYLVRGAIDAAQATGDLTYGAYSSTHYVTHLLASGDALGQVQRDAEAALDFSRRAQFGFVADRITATLRLIRTLRGLTPVFGRFDDAGFDEASFEKHLEQKSRPALVACWYWVRKLQARFYAGDYVSALEAAAHAERLLWTSPTVFERAEYHFYAALARSALCDAASFAEHGEELRALTGHHRQIQEWATNCPQNFQNRAALVGAEMARIEGRDRDAMDLYEQAIRSARDNGFVHNEAIANELAARFYAARGFETISHAYLRNARYCYARWGAEGKVRQLDQLYPHLRSEEAQPRATGTIQEPLEGLDLATVIKVSQTISGEIFPDKLIGTLMRTAVEQAGAERSLLLLPQGEALRIEAEAITSDDAVVVHMRDQLANAAVLPQAVLQYVLHTRESVLLGDASAESPFSADSYIRQHRARSVLCLPLLNQAKLVGVLYLENNLTPYVFAPGRVAVLKLLASQAAVALENSRLYREVAEREAQMRRLIDANIIGIFMWRLEGDTPESSDAILPEANDAFLRVVGYDREDFASGRVRRSNLTPPEWRDRTAQAHAELLTTGTFQPYEKEYVRKDGSRVPVLVGTAAFEGGKQGVSFVLDLTERKRAEHRLAAQHAVTRILAEAATVEEATPKILQTLCECLGWDLATLWCVDPQAGVLRCAELWRVPSVQAAKFEAVTRASTFRPGSALPGRVWESRKPACIPDVTHDPTFLRAKVAAREGLHAAFAFPILLGNEVLGVIDFVSVEIRQPDQDLLDMIATLGSQIGQFIERKRAENALLLAQVELAHVTRLSAMGVLTASIAHEINQPLGAIAANASACLRWLAREPPNLDEARACVQRMIRDSHRAGEVITRTRSLIKKSPPAKAQLDLNQAIQEVLVLLEPETRRHAVLVRTELAAGLPPVRGDRVQLQQVILNLVMNGIEAMKDVADRPRELWIRSRQFENGTLLVSFEDTGVGLDAKNLERVFEAFYTTKAEGMGMGLSISRSIIEAHEGQLWPSANGEHGATFQFTLPTYDACDEDAAEPGTAAGLVPR